MKTLRFVLAATLFTLSTAAFAGNNENEKCDACLAPEYVASLNNDSAALADAGVGTMLRNMTLLVHEQVRQDEVGMLLLQMTRKAHESVKAVNTSNAF